MRSPHVSREQHTYKLLFGVSEGVTFATWLPVHCDTQLLCNGPANDSVQGIKQINIAALACMRHQICCTVTC